MKSETLAVYQTSLSFARLAERWVLPWEPRHGIRDHLLRASESVVLNLAGAIEMRWDRQGGQLEYAIASALECAACLDIARLKGLLGDQALAEGKHLLWTMVRMGHGLRRARVREVRDGADEAPRVEFAHERLDVYRTALAVVQRTEERLVVWCLSPRELKLLDRLTTSIVLNIAEGNGRRSLPERAQFLHLAAGAAIRSGAVLDIGVARDRLPAADAVAVKELLARVKAMLFGLIDYCTAERPRQTGRRRRSVSQLGSPHGDYGDDDG